ncbi:MAG TPA: hypothetical protein VE465_17425, partial [Streptosporangiaceae bacterium]|nr:hypothetical protein [Streptosporangiaceae bacterium]
EPLDDDGIAAVARLVEQAGGRAWASRRLARELAAAKKCLAACAPGPAAAAGLLGLTDLVGAAPDQSVPRS